MAVHSPPTPPANAPHTGPSAGAAKVRGSFTVTSWVLGVVGAIAAFLGAFILLGGDEQSIGLGGEASWTVAEIDPAWGYGLLVVGVTGLLAAVLLALRNRALPDSSVAEHGGGWSDVAAHAAAFTLVNAFLWIQDIALGDGVNYAYWVTIPWGIGLAAHALTQYASTRRAA